MAELTMEELQVKIARWQKIMPEVLRKKLIRACIEILPEVQEGHLSGPRMPRGVGSGTRGTLAVRTGRLRRSIHYRVIVNQQVIKAEIGTNVRYGRIHEYGGTIANGFGRGIRIEMPACSFLRPSVAKMQPRTLELIMKGAVEDSYGK